MVSIENFPRNQHMLLKIKQLHFRRQNRQKTVKKFALPGFFTCIWMITSVLESFYELYEGFSKILILAVHQLKKIFSASTLPKPMKLGFLIRQH